MSLVDSYIKSNKLDKVIEEQTKKYNKLVKITDKILFESKM